jgi:flagellar hook-length control protein FliK
MHARAIDPEPAAAVASGEQRLPQAGVAPSDETAPSLQDALVSMLAPENSDAPVRPSGPEGASPDLAGTAPTQPRAHSTPAAPPRSDTPAPEARFAEVNHPQIITAIRSHLLPDGGSMQLRLDPPELGALQVRIEMRYGAITAAFQTANDQATQLLSHSLGQLKHALESQGVSVEKLQVERAPQDQKSGTSQEDARQQHEQSPQQQQEQQRRELLQRMWRRLSGGADPLDVTA